MNASRFSMIGDYREAIISGKYILCQATRAASALNNPSFLGEPIPDHSPPSRDLSKSSHSVHSIVYWNGSLKISLELLPVFPADGLSVHETLACMPYIWIVPAQDLSFSIVIVWNSLGYHHKLGIGRGHRRCTKWAEKQSSRQSGMLRTRRGK